MKYDQVKVGVDPVIFTIFRNRLHVYLNKREKDPFIGLLELPGGLLVENESANDTIKRKLLEQFGDVYFKQFHTFTNPKRDPRFRVISIGFIALVPMEQIKNKDDIHEVQNLSRLAFDHLEIIKKAREEIKQNISTNALKKFMPDKFPLNKLQEVYEVLENKKYDNRNFRKKILSLDILEDTKEMEKKVSHRPAKLFKFNN